MIFLVGHHAVGKTEAALIFAERGFVMIDTGPIIRLQHQRSGQGRSFCDWIRAGEGEYGPDFTNVILVEAMSGQLQAAARSGFEVAMVGFRSLVGIRYLQKHAKESFARAVIVYFEAPESEVLRRRFMLREDRFITRQAFEALLTRDKDMGLEEIRSASDHFMVNKGCIRQFHAAVGDLCSTLIASGNSAAFICDKLKEA